VICASRATNSGARIPGALSSLQDDHRLLLIAGFDLFVVAENVLVETFIRVLIANVHDEDHQHDDGKIATSCDTEFCS
jgi:hypothetical protein